MRPSPLHALTLLALALAPADAAAQRRIESRAVDPRALPREAAYQGSVVVARRWTDRLGENLLVLAETDEFPSRGEYGDDKETYAYHYVRRDGALSLLWRTTDFVRECDVDLILRLGPETVAVTDLDGDGVAETTFMYLRGCRGGLDPLGLKLIMHEGAAKYAIRGSTDLSAEIGREYGRPTLRVDPSFEGAPAAFRAFAVRHWNRFVRESTWYDGREE